MGAEALQFGESIEKTQSRQWIEWTSWVPGWPDLGEFLVLALSVGLFVSCGASGKAILDAERRPTIPPQVAIGLWVGMFFYFLTMTFWLYGRAVPTHQTTVLVWCVFVFPDTGVLLHVDHSRVNGHQRGGPYRPVQCEDRIVTPNSLPRAGWPCAGILTARSSCIAVIPTINR